jgi:hypothetical protein
MLRYRKDDEVRWKRGFASEHEIVFLNCRLDGVQ